jgi:hypothetical protein
VTRAVTSNLGSCKKSANAWELVRPGPSPISAIERHGGLLCEEGGASKAVDFDAPEGWDERPPGFPLA